MAITAGDVHFWQRLKADGHLPYRPRLKILEIGEANWFGDVPLIRAAADPWQTAKAFYRDLFGENAVFTAIDMNGTDAALKIDLNRPLENPIPSDVVINTGTTEHVFDQRQVFETIHDCCLPDGLMVHSVPVGGGWEGHCFWNYQPWTFWAMARENGYEVLDVLYSMLWPSEPTRIFDPREEGVRPEVVPKHFAGGEAILHIALRKPPDAHADFRVPMQVS